MKKLVALLIVALAFATAPAFADFDKGFDAYEKGDYETAFAEFHLLAEQGDEIAQYNLGLMYKNGEGVPRDYRQALKWFRLSAEQGYAEAQHSLGVMYSNGDGVPQDDYKQAVKFYRLSAEQGFTNAQANLGWMYDNGYGVLQNYVRSHMWYNISASNGNKTGADLRNIVTKKMTPAQIEKAQDLAEKCLANNYQGC